MKDATFTLSDFVNWLDSYNQNKKNQQSFGIQNIPARVFRKTIDLTTANTAQPVSTGLPFNGVHVEKIYNTATGISVDGNVRLNFDRAMIDKDSTYKKLVENDSFTLGFSTANAFISWDAQPGLSADVVFFNDIDFKSGSQKTTVSGQVSVANTSPTALYIKQSIPVSNARQTIAGAGTTPTYTVPVGKYSWVTFTADVNSAACAFQFKIDGNVVTSNQNVANSAVFALRVLLIAGQTATITLTGAAGSAYVYAEEYTA